MYSSKSMRDILTLSGAPNGCRVVVLAMYGDSTVPITVTPETDVVCQKGGVYITLGNMPAHSIVGGHDLGAYLEPLEDDASEESIRALCDGLSKGVYLLKEGGVKQLVIPYPAIVQTYRCYN